MGCSISCLTFEKKSSFIHWLVSFESQSNNLDHYLDDFFFAGKSDSKDCKKLMNQFDSVCNSMGVPIAQEKNQLDQLQIWNIYVLPLTLKIFYLEFLKTKSRSYYRK